MKIRALITSTIALASLFLPANATCKDTSIFVSQRATSNGIFIDATLRNTLEATIHFDCPSHTNVVTSTPLPVSLQLKGPGTTEMVRFTQDKANQVWNVGSWTNRCRYGFPSKLPTNTNYVYELPYERDKSFKVSQSYQGKQSHQKGGELEFSVDFDMPEGTPVLAARPGTVIAIRDDSTEGGEDKAKFEECSNFVNVRHDDGTYAHYVHLKPQSIVVKLGQIVTPGTLLAQSGKTGWVTGPHLHFDVYRVIDGQHQVTVPVRFRTSKGVLDRLEEREFYGTTSNGN